MKSGLRPIKKDHRDYDFHSTFGSALFKAATLPADFSVHDGRIIPDQNNTDSRFVPALPPLPEGCTAEGTTYLGGIETGKMYDPERTYKCTPPGNDGGRDIRAALQSALDIGMYAADGSVDKWLAYFNVRTAGAIDWFDAVRIAIWVNQQEKRAVLLGTWWYPEWQNVGNDGILPIPSFNTDTALLHAHACSGWVTIGGKLYLEDISWQGMQYGNHGIVYWSRELFNAAMAQKYTGAFTISRLSGTVPFSIQTVQLDLVQRLVSFIRVTFKIA